jgi:hypothetical protein
VVLNHVHQPPGSEECRRKRDGCIRNCHIFQSEPSKSYTCTSVSTLQNKLRDRDTLAGPGSSVFITSCVGGGLHVHSQIGWSPIIEPSIYLLE